MAVAKHLLCGRFSGMAGLLEPEPEQPIQTGMTGRVSDIVKKTRAHGAYRHPGWHGAVSGAAGGYRVGKSWTAYQTQLAHPEEREVDGTNYGGVVRGKRATRSLLKRLLRSQSLDGVLSVKWAQITKRRASRYSKWLQGSMCRSQGFGS